ncbi:acyltransferase family protein [Kineococcus sp. T13]|uniref:acyltransferase family protein n=1 Tax=Kineococcus vitellinus TaxID=2696565 RepID=UPI001412874D|nr:acyltransferase [Kineococcus vitellinus]NAZ74991.1 acyltransferase family protein [Kineococcus vitellinus]
MTVLHDPPPATTTPPAGHRGDVEGLRAVAIGLVLLFHAGVPVARGGLVGVDAFFVVSGFLITGLLLREVQRTGTLALPAFYARRARRIVPSAAAVLLAALAAAALLAPERLALTAAAALAAALQVANWFLLSGGTAELAPELDGTPVVHFWSLAVEEQFYLAWPLVVLLVARRTRRRGGDVRRALLVVLAVATALSCAASVLVTPRADLLAYLGTGTRAWQFGVGGLLALLAPELARAARRPAALRTAGWAGAVLLLSSAVWVGAFDYPGWVALVPTLATAAVIASGAAGPGAGVGRLLSLRPVRWLGRLSYTWYLWHVPATWIAVELAPGLDRWPFLLLVELLAAAPALATSLLVERPLRHGRAVASTRAGLLVGALASALVVLAALVALLAPRA